MKEIPPKDSMHMLLILCSCEVYAPLLQDFCFFLIKYLEFVFIPCKLATCKSWDVKQNLYNVSIKNLLLRQLKLYSKYIVFSIGLLYLYYIA